jgi:opacity protein-like surface antigen
MRWRQRAVFAGPWPSSFQCWHAWGNWLLRGEYRYANFGTSSYVFPCGTTVTNNTYRFDVHNQTHIATFGLA